MFGAKPTFGSGTTAGFGGGGGFGTPTPTSSFGATQQTTSFGQAAPAFGQAAPAATGGLFGKDFWKVIASTGYSFWDRFPTV